MAVPDGFAPALRARLADEVAVGGWTPSAFDGPDRITLTRPLGDGFEAVVQVLGSRRAGRRRVASARVYVGTAYRPATALMPRLTLPPEPLLACAAEDSQDRDGEDALDADGREVAAPEAHDDFCKHVRSVALEQATALAEGLADLEALELALRDDERVAPARAVTRLPVLLAATGRPEEALGAVEDFLIGGPDEVLTREYRRFAHQLGVWMAAGAPDPPPLEAWAATNAPAAAAFPPPTVGAFRRLARGLGGAFAERPDWLEPPDHALYPVPARREDPVPVTIDDEAWSWLAHVAAVRTSRSRLLTHCDAWLEPHPRRPGELVVGLGSRTVGRLTGSAGALYEAALAAAARFGELPRVGAHLVWSPDASARQLSLDRPDRVTPPPF